MKHIVIVIKQINNRSGGAERLYCDLANKLLKLGFKVSCLVYESSKPKPFYRIDKEVDIINLYVPAQNRKLITRICSKLKNRYLPSIIKNLAQYISENLDFITQLRVFCKNNNVGASISFMPPANTINVISTLGLKTNSIITNHNVPQEDYENPKRWGKNPVDIFLRKKTAIKADFIHVLFEEFGNWFPIDVQSKIRVIHNFVPGEFFDHTPDFEKREKMIIAVGRLAPVKNYGTLIEAWALINKEFPAWKIEIYGVGQDKKLLRGLINTNGLNNSVFLKGHTKNINKHYERSRLMVHPAAHEGFGLSVAEALAKKVPVIAFQDCHGVNQFVYDKINGLMVDRGTSEINSLAAALKTYLNSPSLQTELFSNSQASISEFNERKYLHKWKSLISEVTFANEGE